MSQALGAGQSDLDIAILHTFLLWPVSLTLVLKRQNTLHKTRLNNYRRVTSAVKSLQLMI